MRRAGVALAALVIVAAGVWTGGWFYVAGRIESGVDQWVADRRRDGHAVDHGAVAVSGFPLAWQVRIDRPEIASTVQPAWSWRGAAVIADVNPLARGEVPLEFPGEHVLASGARSLAIRADRPAGWAWIGPAGAITEFGVDLRDATVRAAPGTGDMRAGRARITVRPRPTRDAAPANAIADIAVDLADVTLPQAAPEGLGREVGRIIVDLTARGVIQPLPLPQAVAQWRDSGGVLDLRRVVVLWGGLAVDADGTLALDAQNRPLGAATARVRGYGEVIDALVAAGAVGARNGATIKIALNLISRPAGNGQGRELEVPLTAQDGRLYAAGFELTRLRPLRFE